LRPERALESYKHRDHLHDAPDPAFRNRTKLTRLDYPLHLAITPLIRCDSKFPVARDNSIRRSAIAYYTAASVLMPKVIFGGASNVL